PPRIDVVPSNIATTDGQQLVSVLFDRKRHKSFSQNRNTRKQEANQMHCMFPFDFAHRTPALLQFLELRKDISVIGLIHESREKSVAHIQKFVRQFRLRLY